MAHKGSLTGHGHERDGGGRPLFGEGDMYIHPTLKFTPRHTTLDTRGACVTLAL